MSATTSSRRNDPEGVRSRLLDGAEALLALRGFWGVTMRDVALGAGVKLGTLTYHFPAKTDLFRAVVERRAPDYARLTSEALDRALAAAGDRPPTTEAIVRAYVTPALRLSIDGGEGWKNYMKMLGLAMSNRQSDLFLAPILEQFDPLLARIVAAFARIYPGASERSLHLGFFLIEAALIHILTEAGIVDRQSGGAYRSSDLETILASAVPFFVAGFDRVMVPTAEGTAADGSGACDR